MAKTAVKSKKSTIDDRDLAELRRGIKAVKAASHNPVDWGAIIKFAGPILGRIAARYAAKFVARKLNKKLKLKLSTEVAEATADKMSDILAKRLN